MIARISRTENMVFNVRAGLFEQFLWITALAVYRRRLSYV